MTIPDYQSLMLPVLRLSAMDEVKISDAVERLAEEFHLTEEELGELLPSGRQTTFSNRVHWAKTYLKQAGLVEATRRGHFKITQRGQQILDKNVTRIDVAYLNQFPEFRAFRERTGEEDSGGEQVVLTIDSGLGEAMTPDDQIRAASRAIHDALGREILDRIMTASPSFFERAIVTLLLAMGYGGTAKEAGRAIGRAGDDGVDGVIDQDMLGLDRVYVQAKRYQRDSAVGPAAIRDFFGSLDMHKATKGLFVTTSTFSKAASETAERLGKRIVLIDGPLLASLMIRFNVGCRSEEKIEIKRLDEEFFE
jgi:restriction system protein